MSSYKELGRKVARAVTTRRPARVVLRKMSQTGLLPEGVWQRLPVQTTFWVSLSPDTGFRYVSSANDAIGRALYWRSVEGWESETIRIFHRLAKKAKLVLDIGANTGVYSLIVCAANPNAQVWAFEPVPRIYQRLCENLKLNGWQDRCLVRHEAVSSFVGLAKFHVPDQEYPSSASLQVQGFHGVQGQLIEVPVTTIDALCSKHERVDLVKIDVESAEDKVLEGMQQVLTESQPAIIVECLADGPYKAVQDILARVGYRFFHLCESGPIARTEIVPDERYRNYLCLPTCRLDWLG